MIINYHCNLILSYQTWKKCKNYLGWKPFQKMDYFFDEIDRKVRITFHSKFVFFAYNVKCPKVSKFLGQWVRCRPIINLDYYHFWRWEERKSSVYSTSCQTVHSFFGKINLRQNCRYDTSSEEMFRRAASEGWWDLLVLSFILYVTMLPPLRLTTVNGIVHTIITSSLVRNDVRGEKVSRRKIFANFLLSLENIHITWAYNITVKMNDS